MLFRLQVLESERGCLTRPDSRRELLLEVEEPCATLNGRIDCQKLVALSAQFEFVCLVGVHGSSLRAAATN